MAILFDSTIAIRISSSSSSSSLSTRPSDGAASTRADRDRQSRAEEEVVEEEEAEEEEEACECKLTCCVRSREEEEPARENTRVLTNDRPDKEERGREEDIRVERVKERWGSRRMGEWCVLPHVYVAGHSSSPSVVL